MGAKISKRGSYSLSKREKKKKKPKISNLEERAPSILCLSQAEIYDDLLKSPDLSHNHKVPEFISENQRTNTGDNNEVASDLASKPSSGHEIYSPSSVEELYENVQTGHGSELEEQLERRISDTKGTSETQETKPRKTWEKPQHENDDEFFDVLEGISNISSSDTGEMTDENPYYVNTGKWNGVFSDEFWSEKRKNEKVGVNFEEIDKIIKEKEEQLEISKQHQKEEKPKEIIQEHSILIKTVEENIDINNTFGDTANETELKERTEEEEQIPIIDTMNKELVKNDDKINVADDETPLFKTNNVNEENEWVLLDPDDANTINENVLYDKNSHIIPADSIEKLRDLLQEQKNAKIEGSNNLQEITEDEEEGSEQVEINKNSNIYVKQPQKVTFEVRRNPSEDQTEVEQGNHKHRTLSKSSSVNSDMYYELAEDGSEQEGTENEDQDLFYDAEGYENEADVQVEVKNEDITFPSKVKTVEEGLPRAEQNISDTNSESDTADVGILIDFEEDLQQPPLPQKPIPIDNLEQIEFVELVEKQKELELKAETIKQEKIMDALRTFENSSVFEEGFPNLDVKLPTGLSGNNTATIPLDINPAVEATGSEKASSTPSLTKPSMDLYEDEPNLQNSSHEQLVTNKEDIFNNFADEDQIYASTNLDVNLSTRLSGHNTADTPDDINPAVEASGNLMQSLAERNRLDQNTSMEMAAEENTNNLVQISHVQDSLEEESCTSSLTKPSRDLYEGELSLQRPSHEQLVANKKETFNNFADEDQKYASTNPLIHEISAEPFAENGSANVVDLERPNLINTEEDYKTSKGTIAQKADSSINKSTDSSPTELVTVEVEDLATNSLEHAAIENATSTFKPMTLSLLSNYQPIMDEEIASSENEFKMPTAINTPEEIAEEQMRQWGQQKQVEIEAIVSEIDAVMVNISSLRVKIDNLGSTEEDREIHAAMYQEVIKIMREVNGINNHDFNEKILEMQHSALNQIHECLRELSLRRFN